jgi:hypothetical protein
MGQIMVQSYGFVACILISERKASPISKVKLLNSANPELFKNQLMKHT